MRLAISLYPHALGRPVGHEQPWEDLAAELTELHPAATKEASPAWGWGTFPKGARRRLPFLTGVSGWCFDVDGPKHPVSKESLGVPVHVLHDTIARVRELGWTCAYYTTYSHPKAWQARQHVKFRIFGPFSQPVPRQRYSFAYAAACDALGLTPHADHHARDGTRLQYMHCHAPGEAQYHLHGFEPGTPCELSTLSRALVTDERIRLPLTPERVKVIISTWKKGSQNQQACGQALELAADSKPFAEEGNRDDSTYRLVQALVRLHPSEEDGSRIFDLLRPAITQMGAPTLPELAEKIRRAREAVRLEALAEEDERAERIRQAFAHTEPDRDYGYTDPELIAFAEAHHCTPTALKTRWILYDGKEVRFLIAGSYSPPYSKEAAKAAVLRDLAPAESVGLWLRKEDGSPKGIDTLIGEYGTAVAKTTYDLTIPVSHYDPAEREYREAAGRLRPLEPLFDEECAEYLRLLSGERHLDLITWLSQLTQLHRTTAALLLTGPAGIGKSLLGDGIASLWVPRTATDIDQAFGSWTFPLVECPFVWSDEKGIPRTPGGDTKSDVLRKMVSDHTRPISKKYANDTILRGCLRFYLSGNNLNIMSLFGSLENDDIQAIAERLFHIHVGEEQANQVRAYLQSVDADSFVSKDRLPRHILSLMDPTTFAPLPDYLARRFLIPTRIQTAENLVTRTRMTQDVLRCMWKMLAKDARHRIPVLITEEGYGLQVHELHDEWPNYLIDEDRPHFATLSKALRLISTDRPISVNGVTKRLKFVPRHLFRDWCLREGLPYEATLVRGITARLL